MGTPTCPLGQTVSTPILRPLTRPVIASDPRGDKDIIEEGLLGGYPSPGPRRPSASQVTLAPRPGGGDGQDWGFGNDGDDRLYGGNDRDQAGRIITMRSRISITMPMIGWPFWHQVS